MFVKTHDEKRDFTIEAIEDVSYVCSSELAAMYKLSPSVWNCEPLFDDRYVCVVGPQLRAPRRGEAATVMSSSEKQIRNDRVLLDLLADKWTIHVLGSP